MNRKALLAVAFGTAAAAVPAAVLAPAAATADSTPTVTVANSAGCYVNTYSYSSKTQKYTEHYAKVKVNGSGWTPGETVSLNLGNQPTATVGANGTFTATVTLGDPPLGTAKTVRQATTAIAASDGNGVTASTKPISYTSLAVYLWDPDGDYDAETSDLEAGAPITFNAAGFAAKKTLYAHYVFTGPTGKSKPKLWKTVSLGKTAGPCGTLHKSTHVAPSNPPSKLQGDYTLSFDTSKTYSSRTKAQALYHFNLG